MLTTRLKAPPDRNDRLLESGFFSFSDGSLWNAEGREVASYLDGLWRCDQGAFISVDFEALILVKFSNPELRTCEELGPFPLRIIAGSMCQMAEVPEIVAEFDEPAKVWFLTTRPGLPMPRFMITAASSPDSIAASRS